MWSERSETARRRQLGLRLAVPAAVALGMAAGAAGANAAPGYQLSVSPKSIGPRGHVVVQTMPRRSCNLQVKVHGTVFSHSMKYGWVKVAFPRSELAGTVYVKTTCAGAVANTTFTIHK